MQNIVLFAISALIWGSTWLMITFQLGVVPPLVSVVYRFSLASLLLFSYSLLSKKSFRFSRNDQLLILLQGLLLFGFNYWMTYLSIGHITSALAAILSTTIVYFNVIFARIFLGDKIRSDVLIGATIGLVGVILIFIPEIHLSDDASETWQGIALALTAGLFASLGNIVSAKTQRRAIPVVQANALGMGYAACFLGLVAFISGYEFKIELTFSYLGSLAYLALFGSVIAFGAFLTLLGRIGPDKAGYVTLVYPVIAMILSSFFEGYHWSAKGVFGLFAILMGNFIAMGKYRNLPLFRQKIPAE